MEEEILETSTLSDKLTRIETAVDRIRVQTNTEGQIIENTASVVETMEVVTHKKDVNFYDYDGTLVYSYTASEIANLSALPANPSHTGLTAQGWNWTLQEIKSYVTNHGECDIGQIYVTDDGYTRLYIDLPEKLLFPQLGIALNGTVTIDWGDGTTSEVTGTSTSTVVTTPHTYSNPGKYVISISNDSKIYLGNVSSSSYSPLLMFEGASLNNEDPGVYGDCLYKFESGDNLSILSGCFAMYYGLKQVTLSNTITSLPYYSFNSSSITHINIPNTVTSIGQYAFANAGIERLILSSTNVSYGSNVVTNCKRLIQLIFPDAQTYISERFAYQSGLQRIIFGNSITSIALYAFDSCYFCTYIQLPNSALNVGQQGICNIPALKKLDIPSQMTSFGRNAFSGLGVSKFVIPAGFTSFGLNCITGKSTMLIDCSRCTTVPSLVGDNTFTQLNSAARIVVPDSLYESWITTTNWSKTGIVEKIVKASEYFDS